MGAAPRPMIAATDTAHDKSSGRRTALRRPSLDGNSDLQDFGARSGFELARVYRHRQHAVISDGAGQLDEPLITQPLSE